MHKVSEWNGNTVRTSISIPESMMNELEKLKKKRFWAVSRSEMIRDLIQIGLDHFEQGGK